MYYYMEKVENGAKAKDLGKRGYLYQCCVIRNHQFWFFLNILRIREPLALDISKTSMTQRLGSLEWTGRFVDGLFDFSKEIEERDYISELVLSLWSIRCILFFFANPSQFVCFVATSWVYKLLGHYHHGYEIIHMYSFFITCKKVKVKPFKTSQVIWLPLCMHSFLPQWIYTK